MKGVSHLAIGTAIGLGIGLYTEVPPLTLGLFALVGGISGLAPDLDTNGLASNKITLSKGLIQMPLLLLGMGILVLTLYEGFTTNVFDRRFIFYVLAGLALMGFSRYLKQKRMLTFTGIGLVITGMVWYSELWLILFGLYIIIASFLPHRSYTHSILGACFFAWIMYLLEEAVGVDGLFIVGTAGYISHLVADMKVLPVNKRGVKLFAPLWNQEF